MILTIFLDFSLMFISEYLKRREGDSNPRIGFADYTLSRRASSATRASFLIFHSCFSSAHDTFHISKFIGTETIVAHGRPFCLPGVHLGIVFSTRITSLVNI